MPACAGMTMLRGFLALWCLRAPRFPFVTPAEAGAARQ
mgnify:CR=1 FL=1